MKNKCHGIEVPKDCCYLSFGKGKCEESIDDYLTIRGEGLILDLNKAGKVIGIELLSSKKARKLCQEE